MVSGTKRSCGHRARAVALGVLAAGALAAFADTGPGRATRAGTIADEDGSATFLAFRSQHGDYIGQGQTWTLTPTDGTLTLATGTGSVSVQFQGSRWWSLRFGSPTGNLLTPGVYEGATRWPFESPTKPGLDVSGDGRGCNTLTGRFVVLEAQYGPSHDVQRLAIDFEQHCEGSPPALYGSVRYQSAVSVEPRLSVAPAAEYEGDGEPVNLGFWVSLSEPADVPASVAYTTLDQSAQAWVDYEPVSGILTFSPGVTALRLDVPVLGNTAVQGNRTLQLLLSSAVGAGLAFGTATGTILEDDANRTALSFASDHGDWIGQGQAWTLTPLDGSISASASTGAIQVHFDGDTWWDLDFVAPAGTPLVPGVYEGATRMPFQSPTTPGLDVSGDARGCNTLTGRFVVLDARYGPAGDVQKLAIDFEQHCEGGSPALFGSVRYNSTLPVEPRISVAPATEYEGDGEPVSLLFWVSLSQRAGTAVAVDYATVDQSARAGTDYTPVTGTVTFPPGVTALAVEVPVLGNRAAQPDRQFTLSLSNPVGATLAFATAMGTILDDDASRTTLTFTSERGDYIGQGLEWALTPLDGTITASSGTGAAHVHFGGATWWDLDFTAPAGSALVPGYYEGATRWPFQSPTSPGLDVSGDARGCNTLFGRFVVLEAQVGSAGDVQTLAIDFEQHCEGMGPALFGSVRINSLIPPNSRPGQPRVVRHRLERP